MYNRTGHTERNFQLPVFQYSEISKSVLYRFSIIFELGYNLHLYSHHFNLHIHIKEILESYIHSKINITDNTINQIEMI